MSKNKSSSSAAAAASSSSSKNSNNSLLPQEEEDNMLSAEKVVSLDSLLENETDADTIQQAKFNAQMQLQESVEEDMSYWARISSNCYADEVDEAAEKKIAKVGEQHKEFARYWVKSGHDLSIISDFQGHLDMINDRVDERIEKKEMKQKAAKRRAQTIALSSADSETRKKHQEEARKAQAVRDAARQKAQAEIMEQMMKPLDMTQCPKVDFKKCLDLLNRIEEKYFKNAPEIFDKLPQLEKEERELVNQCFEHMMFMFHDPAYKKRYQFNQNDFQKSTKYTLGGQVDAYFANVGSESIFMRKILSMAGLRNLIIFGSPIYAQMKEKFFAGNPKSYGSNEGLNLMKAMTGQLVDLDSTVLRCTDPATLNAINASNKFKKLPTFANSDAFAKSAQSQEIAIACSTQLLQDFAEKMKMTPNQIQNRKIDWKNLRAPLHTASDNSDRGNHSAWQYVNCGQNSFHCNVPTLEDVSGALLKSPFHCCRNYCFIFAIYGDGEGSNSEKLHKKVDDFFESCISDTCFNMKWHAIEGFAKKLEHEGTIADVVQQVQAANQKIFTAAFFEAEIVGENVPEEGAEIEGIEEAETEEETDPVLIFFVKFP